MTDFIGRSIDRYHVIEQLGRGGMASVYKAYDTRLERYVAIKFIRAESIQDDVFLARFEREAKALAKMSHPNIVKIHDYGDYENTPYLVMEYIPGGTLKEKLGVQYNWQEAVKLILPIARTLEYTHQHNIIHRDVKPANFLITESGQPMLSDFGIAKIIESEGQEQLTRTGVGIGTPEYMAPEQGMGIQIDHRADIYALGIVLYELVTGKKPFRADTPMAVLMKHITDPLPSPRQFRMDLPENIEKIIFKALAKKPEDRYQNMGELISALEKSRELKQNAPEPATQVFEEAAPQTLIQPQTPAQSEPDIVYSTEMRQAAAEQQPAYHHPAQPAQSIEQPKKKRIWLWVIGGLVGVFLCIFLVIGGILGNSYLTSQRDDSHTATARSLSSTSEALNQQATQDQLNREATQTQHQANINATSTQEAYNIEATANALNWQQTATQQMSYYYQTGSYGLHETFQSNDGWNTGDYDSDYWSGKKEFRVGALVWTFNSKKSFYHYETLDNTLYSNFILTMTGEQVSGSDLGKLGLLLLEKDKNKYYFLINPSTQEYKFSLYEPDDGWSVLLNDYSDQIRSGESNTITVHSQDGQFHFYVNGEFVDEVFDNTLREGEIGLSAGISDADENAVFEFTTLKIDHLD